MKKIINGKYSILIYIAFAIMMIGILSAKKDFHIDEYFSYGLSNSPNGLEMSVDWGITYKPEAIDRLFINYLSMWEGETFDYKTVWTNQREDVHPPLYYALLHTISSFFPGKFSIWFAGSINIIFALLTLYVLRKLANTLFQSSFITNLISVVFVLSPEILSATSFFRMYIMAMFWVTLLTYYFIRIVKQPTTSLKDYLVLFSLSVASALTHYYCVVYLVFICIVYGVWLLIKKQHKQTLAFIGTMALSAATAIGIFPAMLKHVFFGYRGAETIENFSNNSFADYWERLTFFFGVFNDRLFGGLFIYIAICMITVLIISFAIKGDLLKSVLQKAENSSIKIVQWCLIVIPTLFYFFIIAKVTVNNGSERYMVPIYALALISFMGILYYCSKFLLTSATGNICLCIISAIIVINSWKVASWPYLYTHSQINLEQTSDYADVDCLVIYDHLFKVQMSYPELSKYNRVTFIVDYNSYWISDWPCSQNNELVLMLIGADESELQNVLARCPYLNNYEKIESYGYCTSYYLY